MTITSWPGRRWAVAALATAVAAVFIGVPTGVIPTALYHRMTPVQWWSYPVWAVSAILSGLIIATYVRTIATPPKGHATTSLGGGMLSMFAVGCPACNKIVVALVGMSGALNLWAPIQPLLGLLSVGLLAWALRRRLAGERACPAPARSG